MTSKLSEIQWIIERSKVIDVIVGIANAIDDQNWQKLRSYLADEIDVDYSEFRGKPLQRMTAEAYVQQWVEALTNLRAVHISTNHEVTINQKDAQCRSAYRIYRHNPAFELEQGRLDTAGNYNHQLIRVEEEWRVAAIKQTVVITSGDRRIHKRLRNS